MDMMSPLPWYDDVSFIASQLLSHLNWNVEIFIVTSQYHSDPVKINLPWCIMMTSSLLWHHHYHDIIVIPMTPSWQLLKWHFLLTSQYHYVMFSVTSSYVIILWHHDILIHYCLIQSNNGIISSHLWHHRNDVISLWWHNILITWSCDSNYTLEKWSHSVQLFKCFFLCCFGIYCI